jgi:hypothetical protein
MEVDNEFIEIISYLNATSVNSTKILSIGYITGKCLLHYDKMKSNQQGLL